MSTSHTATIILCNAKGSLVTFGFNFGEYDEHIIEAINRAAKFGKKVPDKLWSIYIGVYSDSDKRHIEKLEVNLNAKSTFTMQKRQMFGARLK